MITQKQALATAIRTFGKHAGVRDNRHPSSPELREQARRNLQELHQREPKMTPLADWPEDATVGAYRAALAAHNTMWRAWKDERDRWMGELHHTRYTIGTIGSLFFTVKGEGDTWEEALEKAGVQLKPTRRAVRA